MSAHHLVRVGQFGQVGRFRSADAVRYPRGSRVVVRTVRGLELGEVLAGPDTDDASRDNRAEHQTHEAATALDSADGKILRGMTIEDQLLEARLTRDRDEALAACQRKLDELRIDATLLDVEHLFDGRGLYFYFLGEPPAEVERLTTDLAAVYDANVQFRKFADTLAEGCGPGCGTESAEGHGCTSCGSGCAIADACRTK